MQFTLFVDVTDHCRLCLCSAAMLVRVCTVRAKLPALCENDPKGIKVEQNARWDHEGGSDSKSVFMKTKLKSNVNRIYVILTRC